MIVRLLGDIQTEQGDSSARAAATTSIVELLPRDVQARRALGHAVLKQSGDLQGARQQLLAALDIAPEQHTTFELGDVEYRLGLPDARERFRSAGGRPGRPGRRPLSRSARTRSSNCVRWRRRSSDRHGASVVSFGRQPVGCLSNATLVGFMSRRPPPRPAYPTLACESAASRRPVAAMPVAAAVRPRRRWLLLLARSSCLGRLRQSAPFVAKRSRDPGRADDAQSRCDPSPGGGPPPPEPGHLELAPRARPSPRRTELPTVDQATARWRSRLDGA